MDYQIDKKIEKKQQQPVKAKPNISNPYEQENRLSYNKFKYAKDNGVARNYQETER